MATKAHDVMVIGSDGNSEVSLLDTLDHLLNTGVVIHGSLVISLAGVDLIYLGLNVILTSIETALRNLDSHQAKRIRGE